ncbi:hypothetical protein A584_28706 [Pseudomonas syringae pv. theae ICMP 3923]|nr:hypothetical protein A584_28706 [Pseudomonas syringae pv. theae ICMP 3923]
MHSGKHLTLSTGEDVSIASGKSLLASVAQSISLFAQNAGAKLFTAKGKIELQAQSDAMELTAQQKVMITSTNRRRNRDRRTGRHIAYQRWRLHPHQGRQYRDSRTGND